MKQAAARAEFPADGFRGVAPVKGPSRRVILFMPFEPTLDRTRFECGRPGLDKWFREFAGQHESAACFYLKHGFRRFADHSLRLFMTTKDLRATFTNPG